VVRSIFGANTSAAASDSTYDTVYSFKNGFATAHLDCSASSW
jgi:hypothetical protein